MGGLAKSKGRKTDLVSLAHQQTMELLRLGDKSLNPAIAEAAVEIAKEREKHFHASAKPAPTRATAILVTIVIVAAIALCWYVLLSYPNPLADHLIEIILGGAVAIIALYLLIYGHLTQENFMMIASWFKDYFRRSKSEPLESRHGGTPPGENMFAANEQKEDKPAD